MLELLEEEAIAALGMLGVTNWDQLDMSYLHAAPEVTPPNVLSAFPLLDEGY
jgi:glycolate oxidase